MGVTLYVYVKDVWVEGLQRIYYKQDQDYVHIYLQKADALTLSQSSRFFLVGMIPIEYL